MPPARVTASSAASRSSTSITGSGARVASAAVALQADIGVAGQGRRIGRPEFGQRPAEGALVKGLGRADVADRQLDIVQSRHRSLLG